MATNDCKDCVDGGCSIPAEDLPVKHDSPGCFFSILALLGLAVFLCATYGCMTPEQASRSTRAEIGDVDPTVKIELGAGCSSNCVSVVIRNEFGDGAISSNDSSGSTETQTQTPNFDISPKTDVRYNDALAAASTTSRGILETLTTAGANKVLALMQSGGTGTVTVEKTNGTQATVECKDGQCTSCTDCELKP